MAVWCEAQLTIVGPHAHTRALGALVTLVGQPRLQQPMAGAGQGWAGAEGGTLPAQRAT